MGATGAGAPVFCAGADVGAGCAGAGVSAGAPAGVAGTDVSAGAVVAFVPNVLTGADVAPFSGGLIGSVGARGSERRS